jgi:glycine dehydrogenase subunit 2
VNRRGPIDTRHLVYHERPIFEQGAPGRVGASLPELDVPEIDPAALYGAEARSEPAALPEVGEVEATRHFTRLSRWNHAVDIGPYLLGSCTMKYNPKLGEQAARLPGFAGLHPAQPEGTVGGALELMASLEEALCAIGGFSRAALSPASGAHGELCGLMMIAAYHRRRGVSPKKLLVPDSAHGTNAASSALSRFEPCTLATGDDGLLHLAEVEAACARHAGDVAGLMITNPSTLGIFEEAFGEIIACVHAHGGLVYMDGANFNALLGKVRPGSAGVDAMHLNLHKTFGSPHGGGGPGAGPVCVAEQLTPFLPIPTIERIGGQPSLSWDRPASIGRVRSFFGNFGVMVRAYAYIRALGGAGLTEAAEMAVLNANYLRVLLRGAYTPAFDRPSMHEVVISDARLKRETGVRALDIAKRLIDYGYHPPTMYFPAMVPGALMIEPTEIESRETLDAIAGAFLEIAEEARAAPEILRTAPHTTGLRRLDETRAARQPRLRWAPAPAPGSAGQGPEPGREP